MTHSVKTAISLPWEEFRLIEAFRRESRQSRSKVMLEAIRTWLRVRRAEELERRYVMGYRKRPEKAQDIEGLLKAGLMSFNKKDSF